jgi:hypothetical protein
LFKLLAKKSRYLIAREDSRIAGAIGFNLDPVERVVRVFELISPHDDAVRFLLFELDRFCRLEWNVAYIEIDVSAYAPRMQRTLLELGFSPAAYIPAMAFHEVERLDVVKMVRLFLPLDLGAVSLTPPAQRIADIVLRGFHTAKVLPRIAEVVESVPLFRDLTEEQINRLAGICGVREFEAGATIFKEGETATTMFVVLAGQANIYLEDASQPVGAVTTGECLGELSALSGASHSATARAAQSLEVATIDHTDFAQLVRLRPDIGVQIYKNLAVGLGEKLRRSDTFIAYIAREPVPDF